MTKGCDYDAINTVLQEILFSQSDSLVANQDFWDTTDTLRRAMNYRCHISAEMEIDKDEEEWWVATVTDTRAKREVARFKSRTKSYAVYGACQLALACVQQQQSHVIHL
jgi:hypothetical protein